MADIFPLQRSLLADVRSLYPGGSAGVIQLMDPQLGAAVAAQSDFFGDPFGRVYLFLKLTSSFRSSSIAYAASSSR